MSHQSIGLIFLLLYCIVIGMATQLLVAGIETREEYANVSSAIAKGTCAKQDRNVNHTIINDTSRKRDGPFRSKSSTLITLSNLEFWNFHPIEAVQLSPSYLSTNVTIFYKSASVKSDMLNLTICRNYNESCPIKPLDAARHKAIAELRGPSHASKYSLIIIARTRFNVSSYVALPAAISFSTLPYDFPVAGDFTNVLSASNTELNLTNVTVSWRMSDRDFVEATPLAFFIVTLEIPGGKRYVLCVNSTFVTLNNLRRFAFFSLAVTPMFEVDGAIYSGLSSRYNFTTEAHSPKRRPRSIRSTAIPPAVPKDMPSVQDQYPTVQNLQVRIQVLTKKSIQYNVTWTAPYLDHPAKQYYTITWCNSSNYCRNNLTHHTNYTIALHYGAGSYTVTVGVEYFTENEGSFARNVTFQITTPPRVPPFVSDIKFALVGFSRTRFIYKMSWMAPMPRSTEFPQLAYFSIQICEVSANCFDYSTLERFVIIPLLINKSYKINFRTIYELLPGQTVTANYAKRVKTSGTRGPNEESFPTPSDVMLHVVDFNSDTIAYQVTWALQPYKKVKPHDTRITICKVSLCESFKSNLTSYALSVGYQEDVLVTVETDYVLPDGQVISRNKTHRIKAPPSEPFAVWGIKSAITATGADSAVYTFNWKGYKPRSSKFPQLAYFALRACKNANVSCWYYSTLETFYSLPLKFKEKYEVAVSAVYELLPHQLTNKTVMLKITVPEQSELSSHIGQVKKGYISLPLWVAIFIPLIMLTFAVAVTVHQLYIHCHDDSDRIIRPETVSMTPSDENLTESQENTYQRKQTKKTKQSAIKSRSEPPERTR
ncbi:uncharacterized protein LOC111269175 isoform X1 [Varroa jacobsoni]|uniref:uncharacterized protein LOC111269175 isoform X1 n=2 Tax=Varroa jacobsoni TaxID=62625 RepID=UPI000BF5BDEF|nr:uncharacterized protein LOC111269175 isoform X1 [Varroa jacobsoni]